MWTKYVRSGDLILQQWNVGNYQRRFLCDLRKSTFFWLSASQVPIRSGVVGTHLMVEEVGRQIFHGRVCPYAVISRWDVLYLIRYWMCSTVSTVELFKWKSRKNKKHKLWALFCLYSFFYWHMNFAGFVCSSNLQSPGPQQTRRGKYGTPLIQINPSISILDAYIEQLPSTLGFAYVISEGLVPICMNRARLPAHSSAGFC